MYANFQLVCVFICEFGSHAIYYFIVPGKFKKNGIRHTQECMLYALKFGLESPYILFFKIRVLLILRCNAVPHIKNAHTSKFGIHF